MTKILDALRTPGAMLFALVLALVAQLEHTAQVFLQVIDASGPYAQVHAYAFAGAVEVAVLLFVLAGHRRISYGFALATFATNLSYYAMYGVDLLSIAGAPAWLMAALLPAAIVGYSHTIADTQPAPDYKPARATEAPQEAATVTVMDAITTITASEAPAPATPASEAVNAVPEPEISTPQPLTPAQRRAQVRESGMSDAAQVAAVFGVSLRTAQGDLAKVRSGMTQTNGRGA